MADTPAEKVAIKQNYQNENLKESLANEQHVQSRSFSAYTVTFDFIFSSVYARRVQSWQAAAVSRVALREKAGDTLELLRQETPGSH